MVNRVRSDPGRLIIRQSVERIGYTDGVCVYTYFSAIIIFFRPTTLKTLKTTIKLNMAYAR
jgi:hypothetical protein